MSLDDRSQESSNIQNRQRLRKSSQKSNNFVGALNQGLVSLGEKLGKPSSNYSGFVQNIEFILTRD